MVSAGNIDGARLETDASFTTCCDRYMQGFTSVTACVIWCKARLRSRGPLPMTTAGFFMEDHRITCDAVAGAAVTVHTCRQCRSTKLNACTHSRPMNEEQIWQGQGYLEGQRGGSLNDHVCQQVHAEAHGSRRKVPKGLIQHELQGMVVTHGWPLHYSHSSHEPHKASRRQVHQSLNCSRELTVRLSDSSLKAQLLMKARLAKIGTGHEVAQQNVMQTSTVRYSTALHSTAQHTISWYSTA